MFDLITINCSFEYRSTFVNNQTRMYPGQGTMENINLNIQNKKTFKLPLDFWSICIMAQCH